MVGDFQPGLNVKKVSRIHFFVPGLFELQQKKHFFSFLFFLALLTPMILRGEVFIDGLLSFFLSLCLILSDLKLFRLSFNPDIVEYWIASLFLCFGLVSIFIYNGYQLKKSRKNSVPSYRKILLSKITEDRTVVFFLRILSVAYGAALLCPFLAPYDPNESQDLVVTRYLPPMHGAEFLKLKSKNESEFTSDNSIHKTLVRINRKILHHDEIIFVNSYQKNGKEVRFTQGIQSKTIFLSLLVSDDENEFTGTKFYLLGSDKYGRDIFSRLIYGSRISLCIAFLVTSIAVTIGTFIGAVSGYFGKTTDTVLMRGVDLLLAFPNLFLILLVISLFGNSIVLIIVVLGLTGWMGVSRIVRGQILSLKEQEFIQAAHALGFSHLRIIFKHLIPNTLAQIIVAATLRLGGIILIEAGLSFLGIGVQPPTASWGNMVSEGRDSLIQAWWISTFPGLAIVLTVVSFNLIGDGLRDALDPKIKN